MEMGGRARGGREGEMHRKKGRRGDKGRRDVREGNEEERRRTREKKKVE